MTPVQGITDIALFGFWLILVPWIFISSYTTIYFFVKNIFLECLYFSKCDIRIFLLVFWLRNWPSIKYVRNWWNGGRVKQNVHRCAQEEGVEKPVIRYVRTPPRWSPPYRGEEAYPPRSSNQSASTRRVQLSVVAEVIRPTDLLNQCQDLNQHWLDKIRKVFFS